MHQQIRAVAQISPPDLVPFLDVLKTAGVNILGVSGGSLEFGGVFVIAPDHDQVDLAMDVLKAKGYKPERLYEQDDPDHPEGDHFRLRYVTNEPGALHAAIWRWREST